VFVGPIELFQGIAETCLIIEDAVPFQTADDLEAQVLDAATEGWGVNQASTGR